MPHEFHEDAKHSRSAKLRSMVGDDARDEHPADKAERIVGFPNRGEGPNPEEALRERLLLPNIQKGGDPIEAAIILNTPQKMR